MREVKCSEIIMEELIIAMNNGSSDSYLGMLAGWTIFLSSETCTSIAKAALHHTADNVTNKGSGRCQCGGVKALKFIWREGNDSVPFFWGGLLPLPSDKDLSMIGAFHIATSHLNLSLILPSTW